jgi:hypothetical protein
MLRISLEPSLNEGQLGWGFGLASRLSLTEVHVPGLADFSSLREKPSFGAEFSSNALIRRQLTFRSKYQSYWYGNPVALTIYVNANELGFSPNDWQRFASVPAQVSGVSFHPRG